MTNPDDQSAELLALEQLERKEMETSAFVSTFMSTPGLLSAAIEIPRLDERDGMLELIEGERTDDPERRKIALRKIENARSFQHYVVEMLDRVERSAAEYADIDLPDY